MRIKLLNLLSPDAFSGVRMVKMSFAGLRPGPRWELQRSADPRRRVGKRVRRVNEGREGKEEGGEKRRRGERDERGRRWV